jgi:hypothetical protein
MVTQIHRISNTINAKKVQGRVRRETNLVSSRRRYVEIRAVQRVKQIVIQIGSSGGVQCTAKTGVWE